MNEIAIKLGRVLEDRGMNGPALAELLEVNPSTVHRWLKGERTPNGRSLLAIQRKLGLPNDTFAGVEPGPDDDEPPPPPDMLPNQVAALRRRDWTDVEPDDYKRVVDTLMKDKFKIGGDALPEYWDGRITTILKGSKLPREVHAEVDTTVESPEVTAGRNRPKKL